MEVEAIAAVINAAVHTPITGGVVVIAVTQDIMKSHYNTGTASTGTNANKDETIDITKPQHLT